jgi:hypothetical protein
MVKIDPRQHEGINRCFALYLNWTQANPMVERCFKLKDSNPPICGVHKARLIEGDTPIDPLAPYLGHVVSLICPVSQLVVLDSNRHERSLGS